MKIVGIHSSSTRIYAKNYSYVFRRIVYSLMTFTPGEIRRQYR